MEALLKSRKVFSNCNRNTKRLLKDILIHQFSSEVQESLVLTGSSGGNAVDQKITGSRHKLARGNML